VQFFQGGLLYGLVYNFIATLVCVLVALLKLSFTGMFNILLV